MIGSRALDNSVAFRPTKTDHKPSELPPNSLKINGTDPPPLVQLGERQEIPQGETGVSVR